MKLCLIVLLSKLSFPLVTVTAPQSLVSAVSSDGRGSIKYAVSTFGELSYSETFDVELIAPPADNLFGCEPLPSSNTTAHAVWMFKRGECTYSKKAFNGQQAGAFAVITYHNDREVNISDVIPIADTIYTAIKIPIILIENASGEKIIEAIRAGQPVQARIHFEMPVSKSSRVSTELWLNPSYMEGYAFLIEFREIYEKLWDKIDFSPRYKYKNLTAEPTHDPKSCFSNGAFCATATHGFDPTSLLREGLRQICIFNFSKKEENRFDLWFRYAHGYADCIAQKMDNSLNDYKPCFYKIADKMPMQPELVKEIEMCVEGSIEKPEDPHSSRNNLLEEHQNTAEYRGLFIVPAFLINRKLVKESLKPAVIFSALCEVFKEKPQICLKESTVTPTIEIQSSIFSRLVRFLAVGWILCGVLALLLLFVWARKLLIVLMHKEINMEVRNHIDEYMKYSEKSQ